MQHVVARLITGVSVQNRIPSNLLLTHAVLEPLLLHQPLGLALMAYHLTHPKHREPPHLTSAYHLWTSQSTPFTNLMSLHSSDIRFSCPGSELMRHSPFYLAFSRWNSLPVHSKSFHAAVKAAFSLP